jgi:hypothetical protein
VTATCRDCHRPIRSPEALLHERGSQCWRDHLAALGLPAKTLGRGRRNWAPDMPGQELLGLAGEDGAL